MISENNREKLQSEDFSLLFFGQVQLEDENDQNDAEKRQTTR